MIRTILTIILISNLSYAQDAVFINKDDKAPFSGNLLTVEQTKKLYDDSLDKSSLQKQLDLEQKNSTLKDQKVDILLNQNLKLIEANNTDHTLNNWEKAAYFVGGMVAVGLAIKGVENLK